MKINIVLIILLLTIITAACYNDNMEYLYPELPGSCDTTNATYSGKVKSIMDNNCVGCHSSSNPQGSVNLDSYSNVKTYVNNGKLMGSINQTSGFSAMPKGGSKLSNCNTYTIQIWIDKGSLNN